MRTYKCFNCKENIDKEEGAYKFTGKIFCYDCMQEYVNEECSADAIELWIEQNTTKVQ